MYQFSEKDRLRIKKLLTQPLRRVRKGLKKLYPNTSSRINDGRERLFLLYPSFRRRDPKTGKLKREKIPISYGKLTRKEWMYLEGEFEEWDWSVIANEKNGSEFPRRKPQFPVKYWPHVRPFPRHPRPTVKLSTGRRFTLNSDHAQQAAIASWISFINDIPFSLWADAIILLMMHDIRLYYLSRLRRAIVSIEQGAKKLTKYDTLRTSLELLYYTRPSPEIMETAEWRNLIGKVLSTLDNDSQYQDETYQQHLTDELEQDWDKLEGPPVRFEDASRYVAPIARDLYKHFATGLTKILNSDKSKFNNLKQLPMWLYKTDRDYFYCGGIHSRINRSQIHRIVLDLIRFCFKWDKYWRLGAGIKPPVWGGDTYWGGLYPRDKAMLVEAGEQARRLLAKRIYKHVDS